MKTLTETQKKWALTACLMTALSFNLSAHVKADKEISLDFASEGIAFDVTNSKGVRDAKAWKTGDNGEYTVKVEAAPGCNCEPETVDIKVQTDKQGKDLENLIKVATYAKIEAKGDRKAAPKADDESQDPNEDDGQAEQEETDRESLEKEFSRAVDKCGKTDAQCSSNVLIDILKKYDKRKQLAEKKAIAQAKREGKSKKEIEEMLKDLYVKRPSDDQASDWLESEVAQKVLESIMNNESEDMSEYNNQLTYSWALRQSASKQNDKYRAAKRALESLIERIPSGYPDTRKKLVAMVSTIQRSALDEYATKLKELSQLGPNEYQTKVATSQQYQMSMNNLNADLDRLVNAKCGGLERQTGSSPTCAAIRSNYITASEANNMYREAGATDYTGIINNSVRTVQVNGQYGPETRVIISPEALTQGPSSTFGPSSQMQQPRDLSNRSVSVQKAPTSNIVYVGGKAYQEIGDVTTVEQTPSVVTTSDVLRFFDEQEATQQSIRARTELHRQYKINQ